MSVDDIKQRNGTGASPFTGWIILMKKIVQRSLVQAKGKWNKPKSIRTWDGWEPCFPKIIFKIDLKISFWVEFFMVTWSTIKNNRCPQIIIDIFGALFKLYLSALISPNMWKIDRGLALNVRWKSNISGLHFWLPYKLQFSDF